MDSIIANLTNPWSLWFAIIFEFVYLVSATYRIDRIDKQLLELKIALAETHKAPPENREF